MKSIKLVTTTLVVSGLAFMSCKNDYKTKDTEVDTVEEQVEDLENEMDNARGNGKQKGRRSGRRKTNGSTPRAGGSKWDNVSGRRNA